MRLVVTGAGGLLGTELLRAAAGHPRVAQVVALRRVDLDVTDPASVRAVVAREGRPARVQGGLVVVNTAGWTDVDAAESDEPAAFAVNATAPALLAAACAEADATLVHLSTDYVFPGDGIRGPDGSLRAYEPADPTGPRSAYGRTKLAGEVAVRELLPAAGHVVRTSWLYGPTGKSFVRTLGRRALAGEPAQVVDDQRGCPTWAGDLAAALLDLAAADPPGQVWHCAGGGAATWCDLARAVYAEAGADPGLVTPVPTSAFPRPAPRPAWSVLSSRTWADAGLAPPRPWRDALHAAVAEHGSALLA